MKKQIHIIGLVVLLVLIALLTIKGLRQVSVSFNTDYAKDFGGWGGYSNTDKGRGDFVPATTPPNYDNTTPTNTYQFLPDWMRGDKGGTNPPATTQPPSTQYVPPTTPVPTTSETSTTVSCSLFSGATNLKYFGFYGSSHQSIIAHQSALDEQKSFTNAGVLFGYDMNFIGNELDKAHRNGQKILINLVRNGLVLDGYGNWDDNDWTEFANSLQPYYNRGDILGFYIADDFWTMGSGATGYSLNEINRIIALIKQRFPGTITAGILQVSGQVASFNPNVDWVGVEVYPREGYMNMAVDPADIDRLAGLLRSNQKIILIPNVTINWEYGSGTTMSSYYQQDRWNKDVWPVLQKATNNPKIAAIFPYIWQDTYSSSLGAGSLPVYVQNFKTLGSCSRFK